MLHVICLNPAIDKIYRIPDFAVGEDYPGQKPEVRVGGKGVNVARVLSQLGAPVHLYGFLGEGGDIIRKEMKERCVCSFFDVSGACRTTANIIDPKSGRETVITEAGPQVGESDVRELLLELSDRIQPGDIVAASGSIIAGAPADIYAQISRICEEIGAKCALDCNTSALRSSLSGNVRYILGKPNERELCALLQRERTKDVHALAEMARELMPPYEMLLVSMGAEGGILVTREAAYAAHIPPLDVVSTVGSGDAAFAGALFALEKGMDKQFILQTAMSCGAINAKIGGNGSIVLQEFRNEASKIRVIPV